MILVGALTITIAIVLLIVACVFSYRAQRILVVEIAEHGRPVNMKEVQRLWKIRSRLFLLIGAILFVGILLVFVGYARTLR